MALRPLLSEEFAFITFRDIELSRYIQIVGNPASLLYRHLIPGPRLFLDETVERSCYILCMGDLIPRLIVTGLAAAVSPVAVMVLLAVLSKKNARRNSLLWMLGFTATLIALGVIMVYIFHLGGSGKTSKVDGYIDIVLGVLCLLPIPWTFMKQRKEKSPRVAGDMGAFKALTLGCVSMVVNTSTLVIFVSGLHEISKARLEPYESILAICILTFFTLTSVLVPLIIYLSFPARSAKLLAALNAWLAKHEKVITVCVLLVFGIYLLVKGIRVVV